MKANIDIDRISLEDRVTALEGRVPAGGGITLPAVVLTASDIDNAKNNDITTVNGGWIIKAEIPNTGQIAGSTFPGLHIRVACFVSNIIGLVGATKQFAISFSVISPATFVYQQKYDFTWISPQPTTNTSIIDALGNNSSGVSLISGQQFGVYVYGTFPNAGYYRAFSGFNLTLLSDYRLRFTMAHHHTAFAALTIQPSVSIGVSRLGESIVSVIGGDPKTPTGYTRLPGGAEDPRFNLLVPQSWR